MPKKVEEVLEEVSLEKPLAKVEADFGREDLNALRDLVNALVDKVA